MGKKKLNKPEPDLCNLRHYLEYRGNSDVSLEWYASQFLTPDLAVAVMKWVWPDFIVFENGVFIKDGFSERNYKDWMRSQGGDLKKVEAVMNHIHIEPTMAPYCESLNRQNVQFVGEMLVLLWDSALRRTFPDREFNVEGYFEGEKCGDEYTITFYQIKK